MRAPFEPELFGDFLLVQRLSRRAMSEVFAAVRLGDRSGRTFVIKRPPLDERASGTRAQAIEREGEVLAAVSSPCLPALEARGEIAGLPYVAIEHVRGTAVEDLAFSEEPLSAEETRAVALDLAKALLSLHGAGFVHGDVSASNVVVDDAGEAKLIDLGLARRVGEARAEVSGTAGYLAPEAALPGVASAASDVYGWGVVIAECALGRRVFPEEALVSAANRGDAPREVGAWEERVPGLRAALSRDPSARPSIEAIVKGLSAMELDRERLAARVVERKRALSSDPVGALTPTAPMVTAKDAAPKKDDKGLSKRTPAPNPASMPVVPVAPTVVDVERPVPRQTAPQEGTSRRIALVLGIVVAFAVGQVSARWMLRSKMGSVSYAGAIPARATLEVDGQRIAIPLDGQLLLAPGEHTLAIVPPKAARREYSFHLHPNEHVVLLPMKKANGKGDEDMEEREP